MKITYSWCLLDQKSNKFAYLIMTNYANIKYIQRRMFCVTSAITKPNCKNAAVHAIEELCLCIINNKTEVK